MAPRAGTAIMGPVKFVGAALSGGAKRRGRPLMITAHALNILVMALGLAFVLIAAATVHLQQVHQRDLAKVNDRLNALEAAGGASHE